MTSYNNNVLEYDVENQPEYGRTKVQSSKNRSSRERYSRSGTKPKSFNGMHRRRNKRYV